jgi:hypothetical protein
MRKFFWAAMVLACVVVVPLSALGVTSNKPETHDGSWLREHGPASRINEQECLDCHQGRTNCIQCHQDTQPRSHTPSWIKRSHGLEARWGRETCMACHREDMCIACHSSTPPSTHRPGWGAVQPNRHCTSCHFPISETSCFTCHKTSPHPPGFNQ